MTPESEPCFAVSFPHNPDGPERDTSATMIQGRLERLLSHGFLEGWACDGLEPHRPVTVEARAEDGEIVAAGLANLFSDDLASDDIGLGWCAFSLKLSQPVETFRHGGLSLIAGPGRQQLDFADGLPLVHSQSEASSMDPFSLTDIRQLRACGALFDSFLRIAGPRVFARTAYIYVFDRPADPESLALHSALIEKGALTPYRLLTLLVDSAEYRREPRRLAAPTTPEFPFAEPIHVR